MQNSWSSYEANQLIRVLTSYNDSVSSKDTACLAKRKLKSSPSRGGMFEKLVASIKEKVDLNENDIETLKPFFIPKKVRKRQYVLNAGDVCQYITFVEKGMLRSFTVDIEGHEHVVQFAIEGWWVSDVGSFVSGTDALYNIEALEDCELLHLTKVAMDELLMKLPVMERFFRLLMQNNIVALQ